MRHRPTNMSSSTRMPPPWGPSVLGLLLAFLGGVLAFALIPVSWIGFLLAVVVSSTIAALLLRSWWAIVAVPTALWFGAIGATLLYGAIHTLLADPGWRGGAVEFAAILLGIVVGPSAVSVLIVRLVTVWLEQRGVRSTSQQPQQL